MLSRVATTVGVGAIVVGAVVLIATISSDVDHSRPTAAPRTTCGGWTAVQMPELQLVDLVATRPDDVWLLSRKGVYHFDGCTWRAHAPFADQVGLVIDWETIVEDPDGSLVVTGESPPGPSVVTRGCGPRDPCCAIGPAFPSRRQSYRFVRGALRWEAIDPRPRSTPRNDLASLQLADARTRGAVARDDLPDTLRITATSGSFAIVSRTRQRGSRDASGNHIGWGTTTSTELWRRSDAWHPVLQWLEPPRPAPARTTEQIPDLAVQAIGGSSPHDRWAVGYRSDVMPDILHFDGTAWTSHRGRFRSDIQYRFRAVSSTSADDAWVIGDNGTVFHFDGYLWKEIDKPSFEDLVEVNVLPGLVEVRDAAGGLFVRAP